MVSHKTGLRKEWKKQPIQRRVSFIQLSAKERIEINQIKVNVKMIRSNQLPTQPECNEITTGLHQV